MCHMPHPFHSSWFYHSHNIGWAVQIIKLLFMYFPYPYPAVKVNSICRRNFGDHQCGFWHNRSTADLIFCICQIFEINENTVKQCVRYL
jgi:hypothetical protein